MSFILKGAGNLGFSALNSVDIRLASSQSLHICLLFLGGLLYLCLCGHWPARFAWHSYRGVFDSTIEMFLPYIRAAILFIEVGGDFDTTLSCLGDVTALPCLGDVAACKGDLGLFLDRDGLV